MTEVFWDVTQCRIVSHGRFGGRRSREYLLWRRRNYVPPKHQWLFTSRHSSMSYLRRFPCCSASPRCDSLKWPPNHFPKISKNVSSPTAAKHASTKLWQNMYLITICWLDVTNKTVCVTSDVWRKCTDRLPHFNRDLQNTYLFNKVGRTGTRM